MNKLDISTFFSEDMLQITETIQKENTIHIYLKSITKSSNCPKCGRLREKYHGTYAGNVRAYPIFGKTVRLHVRAHEYSCMNGDCDASAFTESFNGFLDPYSRMTEHSTDFICSLALETSCEGCSRICRVLGMRISGDTVIRLLLKRYQLMEDTPVGERNRRFRL